MTKSKALDINNKYRSEYKPPRRDRLSMRSGSMDILQAPSRIGKTLFYSDGKKVKDVN